MIPIDFPESNIILSKPSEMEDNQCCEIKAMTLVVDQGPNEGERKWITCWQPTDKDKEAIAMGMPIYISFFRLVPPHMPTTNLQLAISI